jgi:adenylate cyclase class IV
LSDKIISLGNWFYVVYAFQDGTAELMFYDRPDRDGPKLCNYEKCTLPAGSQIASVLSHALGVKGRVKKKRQLFMVGQTRVHIDHVEDLGTFMELEVSTSCFKCRL